MKNEKVVSLATGRIFTGNQAFKNGLIDQLGGKKEAINLAASLAGIEGEPQIIDDTDSWMRFFTMIENMIPSFPLSYSDILNQRRIRLDYILE